MLSGPGQFAENETNEVNFREIPSHVLQKVCMYFTYKVRYTNSSTEVPEFSYPTRNCFGIIDGRQLFGLLILEYAEKRNRLPAFFKKKSLSQVEKKRNCEFLTRKKSEFI